MSKPDKKSPRLVQVEARTETRHHDPERITPVFLTPAQVAELVQVSRATVSRWSLEDASMPAIKIGRVVRFERTALLRWL